MRNLLLQLDGKMPNLALMRLAAHLRNRGEEVVFRHAPTVDSVERGFWEHDGPVFASAIFERTRPVCERLLQVHPHAIVGGSGWDEAATMEKLGVPADIKPDYSLYPNYRHSVGYTQRGCRFNCSFCKVPRMEGKVREVAGIYGIWRGEPWPREVILLDNDFFGQPDWRRHIAEIREGGFKVCFNQGINARCLSDEAAEALASVQYRDDQFKVPRLYTAWDSREDEATLFRGLKRLVACGVKPRSIMVYMLIAYDHEKKVPLPQLTEGDFYRHARLREFGCLPYPMPFMRNRQTMGFQRWIVAGYDRRGVRWDDWERAGYDPRRLGGGDAPLFAAC